MYRQILILPEFNYTAYSIQHAARQNSGLILDFDTTRIHNSVVETAHKRVVAFWYYPRNMPFEWQCSCNNNTQNCYIIEHSKTIRWQKNVTVFNSGTWLPSLKNIKSCVPIYSSHTYQSNGFSPPRISKCSCMMLNNALTMRQRYSSQIRRRFRWIFNTTLIRNCSSQPKQVNGFSQLWYLG